MSQKRIAEIVGVHPSIISRELKRNLTRSGNYSSNQANEFAKERQRWKNKSRSKITPKIKADIIFCLVELKWSPEQIAGRFQIEGRPMTGKTTI
ncbi:helix-turn-helix domain-containing protein [Bacteroides ihuae]|uniref:helix-turn-helix domain-containing protein n=1 Tax=Bacteroides ihuae TaxID=1852362 RepID=UPI0008D949F4|nr:helix-turn-helix domain-containing protein [Bacteroides ihuae]